jgi:hypothetical protein
MGYQTLSLSFTRFTLMVVIEHLIHCIVLHTALLESGRASHSGCPARAHLFITNKKVSDRVLKEYSARKNTENYLWHILLRGLESTCVLLLAVQCVVLAKYHNLTSWSQQKNIATRDWRHFGRFQSSTGIRAPTWTWLGHGWKAPQWYSRSSVFVLWCRD